MIDAVGKPCILVLEGLMRCSRLTRMMMIDAIREQCILVLRSSMRCSEAT
jgi:hypothetical protein